MHHATTPASCSSAYKIMRGLTSGRFRCDQSAAITMPRAKQPATSPLRCRKARVAKFGKERALVNCPFTTPQIVSTGFQQELTAKQEESFVNRPAVRLFMPDHLKSILVDDWEKVTKDSKLAAVPSPAPITKFLNEYYAFESNNRRPGSPEADMLEEFIAGIKEYFNQALGRMLLYRFERQQLHDVRKQIGSGHGEHAGKSFADMYGCEHLLRLFGECDGSEIYDLNTDWEVSLTCYAVSLPDLIAHTNMDTQAISRMREELTKITQWLAKRVDKYIYAPYEHAGQEYLDSAKNAA